MGRSTRSFERVMEISLAHFQPPEAQWVHARIARAGLDAFLASAEEKPEEVITYVDGVAGASEDRVKFGGIIRYEFRWRTAATVAAAMLDRCIARSPVRSGAYKRSWIVVADGREVPDPASIKNTAREIIITNRQPYHRKLEVTVNAKNTRQNSRGQTVRLPSGIVEAVRQEAIRRYGAEWSVEVRFVHIDGGYVLKGRQRSVAAKYAAHIRAAGGASIDLTAIAAAQNRQSSAFRAGRSVLVSRKDTRAGQPMTYPALVLTRKALG